MSQTLSLLTLSSHSLPRPNCIPSLTAFATIISAVGSNKFVIAIVKNVSYLTVLVCLFVSFTLCPLKVESTLFGVLIIK